MIEFVLDCSISISWVLVDEDDDYADGDDAGDADDAIIYDNLRLPKLMHLIMGFDIAFIY